MRQKAVWIGRKEHAHSIQKNETNEHAHLQKNFHSGVDSFREVFLIADTECRLKLYALRNTWKDLLSESTLKHLDTSKWYF